MKQILLLILLVLSVLLFAVDSWKQEIDSFTVESSIKRNQIEILKENTSIESFGQGKVFSLFNDKHTFKTIRDNGNWFIDQIDTGLILEGVNGKDAHVLISINDNRHLLCLNFLDSTIITSNKETLNFITEKWNGKVKPDGIVFLSENYIRKNTFLSFNLNFESFQPVFIGRGQSKFAGYYLEIQDDSLFVYKITTKDIQIDKFKHNLIFKNKLNIKIDCTDKSRASLTLCTETQKIHREISWWAGGEPFLKNNGGEMLTATLNFQAKDITSPVWIYGDSYIDWLSSDRWPYYIYQLGYTRWLANHLPGGNSRTLIQCFMNDLNFGTPIYALWCLGMNDTSDLNNIVDEDWLKNINEFISICKSKGITPILSTIPSVPGKNHKYKSQWIRESGHRYIDFSLSVSPYDSSIWFDGMISKDSIHPSALGAKAMAMQVLTDFPEITKEK